MRAHQSLFLGADLLQDMTRQAITGGFEHFVAKSGCQRVGGAKPCVLCSLLGNRRPGADHSRSSTESSDCPSEKVQGRGGWARLRCASCPAACGLRDPKRLVATRMIRCLTRSRLGHACPRCPLGLSQARRRAPTVRRGHRPFFRPCPYSAPVQNNSWVFVTKMNNRDPSKRH